MRSGGCPVSHSGTLGWVDSFRYALMAVAGAGESDGADLTVGLMQVFAEQVDHLHTDITVFLEEAKQIGAADSGDLYGLQDLGGDFVGRSFMWPTGEDGAQAEHLARGRDTQSHAAAAFGADRKAHASLTDQERAASGLAFAKQNHAVRPRFERLDLVEVVERIRIEIAEDTIGALRAVKATLRHISLPDC